MSDLRVALQCLGTGCEMVRIEEAQGYTDSLGRALFDVSSLETGQFEIQAKVQGIVIPQTVILTFN